MGQEYFAINTHERQIIETMHGHAGIREIARVLHRSPSSIKREIDRNSRNGVYGHKTASRLAEERLRIPRRPHRLSDPVLRKEVEDRLGEDWSPEQIEHRRKLEGKSTVSHGAIRGHVSRHPNLAKHLRGVPAKRKECKSKHERIHGAVSISQRPASAGTREECGHWEGDTVRSAGGGKACVMTFLERKTRYLVASLLPAYKAVHLNAAAFAALYPLIRLSLTVDNGMEFGGFKTLCGQLGTAIYFAHPGCPWERGGNEHFNGLLRWYFPKGTDFSQVSEAELQAAVDALNDRPCKALGYRTPREVMAAEMARR
jgi:transposase, IS30 family